MELISIRRAAAMCLVKLDRTNPFRKSLSRVLTPLLVEKYGFLKAPQTAPEMLSPEGLLFTHGERNGLSIDELRITPGGVLAATGGSTSEAESLVHEVFQLWPDLGLTFSPDMIDATIFASVLTVRSSVHLSRINPAISALVNETFADQPAPPGHTNFRSDFFSVGFFTLGDVSSSEPAVRIERLVDGKEDEYYAVAPLTTERHVKFLNEFESLLKATSATEPQPPSSQSPNGAS